MEAAESVTGLINPAASCPSHKLPSLPTCHPFLLYHPDSLTSPSRGCAPARTPYFLPGPLQMGSCSLKENISKVKPSLVPTHIHAHICTHMHAHAHMQTHMHMGSCTHTCTSLHTHSCTAKRSPVFVWWTDPLLLMVPSQPPPAPTTPSPSLFPRTPCCLHSETRGHCLPSLWLGSSSLLSGLCLAGPVLYFIRQLYLMVSTKAIILAQLP